MPVSRDWPDQREALIALQGALAELDPPRYDIPSGPIQVAGCFVCFGRGGGGAGHRGDRGWAGGALVREGEIIESVVVEGRAAAPYEPGLLSMREGPLLARAVSALSGKPDVLLVNATGRDHPRGAGLALQLGYVLDLPSIGVTDRPLLAQGGRPSDEETQCRPLLIEGDVVAACLRVRDGARPLVVHSSYRVELNDAIRLVRALARETRTPLPIREARRRARTAREAATKAPLDPT